MSALFAPVLPLLAVCVSAFFFSFQPLFANMLEGRLPSFELVTVRGITQFLITLVMIRRKHGTWALEVTFGKRTAVPWLILRGVVGSGGFGFGLYASQLLPLADAQTLVFTAPVFTVLVSGLWLRERPRLMEMLALVISMSGAVLVTRPSFLFGGTGTPALPLSAVLIALYAACCSGSVFPIVRHLGSLKVDELLVVHYQALLGFIVAVPCFFATGQNEFARMPRDAFEWAVLSAIGPLGFIAQSFMVWGMSRERSGPASAMRLWDVVFSFIWQATLLSGEPLLWQDIAGGSLVALGTLTGVGYKMYNSRSHAPVMVVQGGKLDAALLGEDTSTPVSCPA